MEGGTNPHLPPPPLVTSVIYSVYTKLLLVTYNVKVYLLLHIVELHYILYRVIRNDCWGSNNLSYTTHVR